MEFVWDTGTTFFGNPRAVIDSAQTPYQGILIFGIKVLQVGTRAR